MPTKQLTTSIAVTGDLDSPTLYIWGKVRVTQHVIQVLYKEHIIGTQPLTADVTVSATVAASLKPYLRADITVDAIVAANITEVTLLTSTITASATVTAELRENIQYLTSAITADGDIDTGDMWVNWRGGNTLQLTQEATFDLVLSKSVENTLVFEQTASYLLSNNILISQTLAFAHEAGAIRVLATQTASNTITFTQALTEYREAISYLLFSHDATGLVSFLEGDASNALSLTDSVSLAGSIFNIPGDNQLNLTHLADWSQIQIQGITSDLDLNQNAFAVVLEEKKYILLQAPFGFIQTSVVLPNPLLDDNESLVSDVLLRRSMDGTAYTFIQTSTSRRLRYTFTLDRMKAIELEEFFDSYNGAHIKMLNWKGEIWRVRLITNPLDFVQTKSSRPGGDRTDVNLEFEGVLLNG